MIEAVRTTASPTAIWVIVVIMSLCTAFLVAATATADAVQKRAFRRMRMTVRDAPGPVRSGAPLGAGEAATEPAVGAAGGAAAAAAGGLPSPRTSPEVLAGQEGSRARDAAPAGMAPAGTGTGAQRMDPANRVPAQRQDTVRQAGYGDRDSAVQDAAEAPTEPIPTSERGTPERAVARGRHAGGDQEAAADPAAPTGRHAMPAQRRGESDRAERSFAGPSPDPDETEQG